MNDNAVALASWPFRTAHPNGADCSPPLECVVIWTARGLQLRVPYCCELMRQKIRTEVAGTGWHVAGETDLDF